MESGGHATYQANGARRGEAMSDDLPSDTDVLTSAEKKLLAEDIKRHNQDNLTAYGLLENAERDPQAKERLEILFSALVPVATATDAYIH
jgi:hypothetical protein